MVHQEDRGGLRTSNPCFTAYPLSSRARTQAMPSFSANGRTVSGVSLLTLTTVRRPDSSPSSWRVLRVGRLTRCQRLRGGIRFSCGEQSEKVPRKPTPAISGVAKGW